MDYFKNEEPCRKISGDFFSIFSISSIESVRVYSLYDVFEPSFYRHSAIQIEVKPMTDLDYQTDLRSQYLTSDEIDLLKRIKQT